MFATIFGLPSCHFICMEVVFKVKTKSQGTNVDIVIVQLWSI